MDTGAAYLEISEGELFVALEYDDGWLRVQRAGSSIHLWKLLSGISGELSLPELHLSFAMRCVNPCAVFANPNH